MNKKQTIITEELNNKIDFKKFQIQNPVVAHQRSSDWIKKIKNKKAPIYIYDIGFNSAPNKTVSIKNHINKTGTNPLRNKFEEKIIFHDITNIYNIEKNAKIAECFGHNKPDKTNRQHIQAHFLCNYTIIAHLFGYKNIFAYVIN